MKKILQIKVLLFCIINLIFPITSYCLTSNDLVSSLPGLGNTKQTQYAGYADAGNQQKIFYWFVAADKNPEQSPIILWTSGGPGTSSLYGFFLENGPYILKQVNNKFYLSNNPSAWNHIANYLVFDQPVGIGLSFADKQHYPKTPEEGTKQFYNALSHFLLDLLVFSQSCKIPPSICRIYTAGHN